MSSVERTKRFSKFVPILTKEDLALASVRIEARYGDIATHFGSDRRTGHRWLQDGPPNTVARFVQLMLACGLTLPETEAIINEGRIESGTNLPSQVREVVTIRGTKDVKARGPAKSAARKSAVPA